MYRISSEGEHFAEDLTADDKNHVHFVPKHNVTPHPKEEMVEIRLKGRDYIFTQNSICASVMTEPNSYLIRPSTSMFVNENGDTWTNESLRANYQSFIGAYNYVNHKQDPELSVGFIADACLRRILINQQDNVFVYYVDILVATSKKAHPQLVQKILAKDVKYLSMGCESFISTCSACGHQAKDETEFCTHLENSKGKSFIDPRGSKRVIAEMLGTMDEGSCDFQEASFLTEVPAFGGATVSRVLSISPEMTVRVAMPKWAYEKDAVQRFVHA